MYFHCQNDKPVFCPQFGNWFIVQYTSLSTLICPTCPTNCVKHAHCICVLNHKIQFLPLTNKLFFSSVTFVNTSFNFFFKSYPENLTSEMCFRQSLRFVSRLEQTIHRDSTPKKARKHCTNELSEDSGT